MTASRRTIWCAIGILTLHVSWATAQSSNPTSVSNPYFGSVNTVPATDDARKLSLDDAVRLGLEHNLALTLARENERSVDAQYLSAFQALLPELTASASKGLNQFNLEAQGFTPAVVNEFRQAANISSGTFVSVPTVNVTTAKLNLQQSVFSLSAYDLWRGAKVYKRAALYNTQSSRGLVVLNVGTAYLQAIAASSQLDYARQLLRADEVLLKQAVAEHEAGTVANLDELRARVQYQTQQQTVIAAENSFEKSKILLNREIGLAPEQKITLTDAAPYHDLAPMTLEEAKRLAYENRQDYQAIKSEIRSAELILQAAKHERLPTLSISGNYGLTGVTPGIYHGTMEFTGTLNIPLFHEAQFRGNRDVAYAQLNNLQQQAGDLRGQIDAQVRDSFLDVQTSQELVRVAKSNLELATRALQDESDRFTAGIDDNLPLVQAQASLSNSQTQLVQSLYRFNQAKLQLARNLGIVDIQYKQYLGK
jgi:outer membrane protein TolC